MLALYVILGLCIIAALTPRLCALFLHILSHYEQFTSIEEDSQNEK